MMKKFVQIAALCAAAAALTVSCSKKQNGETGLVYWSMWNEAEPQGQVIARAAEAFSKETGIKVEINFNGRDIRKTLQPALDAGETIDLFDEDIERVANTWGAYLLPVDSYADKTYSTTGGKPYSAVVNKTLLNLAREVGGGQLKNIPYQPSAFVTMYNKDLFDKAGITAAPQTWDEFLDACAKLKAIDVAAITVDDAYMAFLFGYTIDRIAGLDACRRIAESGNFSGPEVIRFGELWENMVKNGYIASTAAANVFPQGQINDFAKEKAAMYLNGTWLPNEIKSSAPTMRWGAFAWPAIDGAGDGITANHFGAQSFGINKNSKHPEEAFRFIVYLTTGEWDAELAHESIGIPMADSSEWPQALIEAKVVVDATAKRLPWAVCMEDKAEINAKIKENFAKLIKGSLNAAQFAENMAK